MKIDITKIVISKDDDHAIDWNTQCNKFYKDYKADKIANETQAIADDYLDLKNKIMSGMSGEHYDEDLKKTFSSFYASCCQMYDDMKSGDYIPTIQVKKKGSDYELFAGTKAFVIANTLGWTKINCKVV